MAVGHFPDDLRVQRILERVDRLGLQVRQDDRRPRYSLDTVDGVEPLVPFDEPLGWPMTLDQLEEYVTKLEGDDRICGCQGD